MPQAITPALLAALASKLQAGAAKRFEGEIEIDHVVPALDPVVDPAIVQSAFGASTTLSLPGNVTPGNIVLVLADAWKSQDGPPDPPYTGSVFDAIGGQAAWTDLVPSFARTAAGGERSTLAAYAKVADGTEPTCQMFVADLHIGIYELEGCTLEDLVVVSQDLPGAGTDLDIGSLGSPAAGQLAFLIAAQYTDDLGGGFMAWDSMGWTVDDLWDHPFFSASRPYLIGHRTSTGAALEAQVGSDVSFPWAGIGILVAPSDTGSPATVSTARYQVARLSIDRSRKQAAAQLNATLDNESGDRGYYSQSDPIFLPNNPVRGYAWYGVRANRVRIFTGILDRDSDHREPETVELKARSRMSILLEPHRFVATAPQTVDETGAVRTEDNGVYLAKSPEYIAGDIATRAGWSLADRDFATSGIVIPEYVLSDQGQWLDQIAGSDRLTTIVGWDLREDELGVLHFGPNALASVTEPDPDWTFEPGVNVLAYDHQADHEERVTRVRVSGPMTSDIPAWQQEWATTALLHPVGAMYRPSEPGYLYVVDRVTQYLYKLLQSNRKVVAKWYLGASLTNQPIGLSGDPTDATHFYVLDAHLPGSGTYTNCKVRKFNVATKALVATTTLADGQWSDMKFDGSHLWLTNFGDDRLYEKTFVGGGAAGATASFSYAGKTNPTGLYLNGTTIGLFFNGGEAFSLVDTSAPATITGTESTKGTRILGGEADTTTDADLYATNEAGDFGATAGHVWKFQLTEEITKDVVKWAYDSDLEDELGLQAGIADRVHDRHPLDPAHAFDIRIATVELRTVNDPAQCQAVADATLALRKRLRRTLDLVTTGNPAIQIDDVARYADPVAATDAPWMIDTYRTLLEGTYTTSMSVLPWEAPP